MPSGAGEIFEYQSLLDGSVLRYLVPTEREAEPRFSNVYCIVGPPHVLIDAGLKLPGADAKLLRTLQASGCDPAQIESIVITHGHTDHFGLANDLVKATGAHVYIHDLDRDKLVEGKGYVKKKYIYYRGYFNDYGVPLTEVQKMEVWENYIADFAETIAPPSIERLEDTMSIDTPAGPLTALHLPGHSSGSCGLLLDQTRTLFSGDTVMYNVVPLPLLEPPQNGADKPRSLVELFDSFEKLKQFEVNLILPGHGDPIASVDHTLLRIERYFNYGCKRLKKVLADKPTDLYRLKLSTDLKGLQIDLALRYSEVIGMLEYMIGQQAIELRDQGRHRLFALVK